MGRHEIGIGNFSRDNTWQRPVRDRLITPFYEQRYRDGRFKHFEDGDVMQVLHHIDTEGYLPKIGTEYIDEKIMRRRNDGGRPVKVSCETLSCSLPGLETKGWIYNDKKPCPTWLLYCFANAQEAELVTALACLWIPFSDFREWFFAVGEDHWPLHVETEENCTHSRNIPIHDIMASVPRVVAFELNLNGKHHTVSKQFDFVNGVWP